MNSFDQINDTECHSIINSKAHDFKEFIKCQIGYRYFSLLEDFSKEVDVFIFSGMIKDYLLNPSRPSRDIDFTFRGKLRKKWKKIAMDNFTIIENKFGGFKLSCGEAMDCDVWDIEKTYGIDRKSREPRPNDRICPFA